MQLFSKFLITPKQHSTLYSPLIFIVIISRYTKRGHTYFSTILKNVSNLLPLFFSILKNNLRTLIFNFSVLKNISSFLSFFFSVLKSNFRRLIFNFSLLKTISSVLKIIFRAIKTIFSSLIFSYRTLKHYCSFVLSPQSNGYTYKSSHCKARSNLYAYKSNPFTSHLSPLGVNTTQIDPCSPFQIDPLKKLSFHILIESLKIVKN